MRCWLFFNRDLAPGTPEAPEVHRFIEAAKNLDIELYVLKPSDFDLVVDSKHGWSATYKGRELLHKPDLIIPRCGAETTYFTLAVLRHFERQGVPIVNGPSAIESVADKLHTLQIVSAAKLPIPKTILGKFPVDVNLVERELGFPVVIKKLKGTRGNGVVLCQDRAQFDDLANLLDGASGGDFLFQQYIKASHGRDVRILVIGGKVVAAMERTSSDGGFKSNISLGGSGRAFKPPREMAELALNVARELNLDVAGIDVLLDADGYRVCEANSAPGFHGLERACKVNVPETIFLAMGKRFGVPIRHSDRWEAAIEKASKAAFGKPRKSAGAKHTPEPLGPLVPQLARTKPPT